MQTLHEVFEDQAASRPGEVAVVWGSHTVTYRELDERANRFARYLRGKGVQRRSIVAMLQPRSIAAYTSILGILKAGAAYLPIDPEYPAERIAWILEDSGACEMVTEADLERSLAESPEPLPRDKHSANSRDLCYVIYTSGSTGRPKGVMVEHRNAWNLVRAEGRVFEVRPGDRVYQAASLCFDLSVEEIWLAFAAGATLVAATACAGPDLANELRETGVTVLSCVPTLLSMIEVDLPALRLLILGGEVCPAQLVARWSRKGLRIVNTYGPTETTVIATYSDVSAGKRVTIGRAVPGYRVYLLDEQLRPVKRGETGEICIAGNGVARGYLGLPTETRTRFVPDPWPPVGDAEARMYRSGDLGRLDRNGNIEFAGRADGQVKLRGLRVELGEIESALLRDESVQAAACVVSEDARGDSRLVAYVVPRSGDWDEADLRARLRNWLPAWMVPSTIRVVKDLPRLPSGKLDRAALERVTLTERRIKPVLPEGNTERRLMQVWASLFCCSQISVEDDFFLDLGGHSLLAARMVSELRKSVEFASVTVRDVYSHPTISRLASEIDSRVAAGAPEGPPRASDRSGRSRHFVCGAVQTASLYLVFAFRGLQWATPWLIYFLLARHRSGLESALYAMAGAVAVMPIAIVIAVLAKWCLLARIRPGRYPLWGAYYVRWWFVQTLVQSLPLKRLGGTPWLPFVYRLFGARIGKGVHIASDQLAAFDLIAVGDGSSIDEGASLLGYTVEGGELAIGPVSVGRACVVGTRSVVCPGAAMEDGARLEDLSLLSSGLRIPGGETWSGSPAQKRTGPKNADPMTPARGVFHKSATTLLYAALILIFPLFELGAFVPGVALVSSFSLVQPFFWLAAPLAGASFIVCVTTEVAIFKWLLIGRAQAGRYLVHGSFYVRHWAVEQLLALSVDVAGPLHSTIFLKPWYRALGARLGRFVELSNASTTTPDLLDIDDDCTVADEVSLGAARVERGWLTLAPTRIGRRAFVGNGAVIPAGTTLGERSLVGVLTVAPEERNQAARKGASWLGSPPIFLTRRQTAIGFAEATTFRPTRRLQWARGCWELFRISLPGAGFVFATVAVIDVALALWDSWGPLWTLLAAPGVFATCCAAAMLSVVPVKWIVVGRYRPFERPCWSAFVWRLELVNAMFEFMATPIGLDALRGTPLLPWYLRLLGCRVGEGVYMDTTGFLEFDLTEIGDRAILNKACILQTHLFEDRVMKGSRLRVGSDCEIGTQSIVLYETELQDGARLGPLSLVMKGEVLPAGRVWVGSPLDNSMERSPNTWEIACEDAAVLNKQS